MARSPTRGRGSRFISAASIRRGGPVQFFQETIAELRKAVWPTREETVRLTYIVLMLAAAASFVLSGLDFVLTRTFGDYIVR